MNRPLEDIIDDTHFDFHEIDPASLATIAAVADAKRKVIATIAAITEQLNDIHMPSGWRARAITAKHHARLTLRGLKSRHHELQSSLPASEKQAKKDAFAQTIVSAVQQLSADERVRILIIAANQNGSGTDSFWSRAENRFGKKAADKARTAWKDERTAKE